MADIRLPQNRFQYLEDARRYAFQQPGSEVIQKEGDAYLVQSVKTPTAASQNHLLELPALNAVTPTVFKDINAIQAELQPALQNAALPVVEFIMDMDDDGPTKADRRFTVSAEHKLEEAPFKVVAASKALLSIEAKGLEIVRKAMTENHTRSLTGLTPEMIEALLRSTQLTPGEGSYVTTHLNSSEAVQAREQFGKFFGKQTVLSATGVADYTELVKRLNKPENKESLRLLFDVAQYPERFKNDLAKDEARLMDVAKTLKELPGFKGYPPTLAQGKPDKELKEIRNGFDYAVRTIDHYKYKFQVATGVQFDKNGLSSHETELNYRTGGSVWSLSFMGKQGYLNPFAPVGGNTQHAFDDAVQRLRLGYSSSNFDVRMGLTKDSEGGTHIERPESQSMDRYLGRKKDDAMDWAKDHKLEAAGIAALGVAGLYAYSKANPDQELSGSFGIHKTLYETEFLRVRGSISPELILKGGDPDLGLGETALGISGNSGNHFYDANIKHRFKDTTLRSGQLNNEQTETNLRYGYGTHSLMLDSVYNYNNETMNSQLAYRKDIIHSSTLTSYVQPYARATNDTYQSSGMMAGFTKDFGGSLTADMNVGYDQKSGQTAGIRLRKSF